MKDKGLSTEEEWKIYSAINNIVKIKKNFAITKSAQIPKHSEKNLNSFLKLIITNTENNSQAFKDIDFKTI